MGTSLTNYSEFALIAGVPVANAGLIPEATVPILALVVVLSFVVGTPLSYRTHSLYSRLEPLLLRFERGGKHPDDVPQVLGSTRSLVFGMGRTDTAAYTVLGERDKRPVGLDSDPAKIEHHLREGRRVAYGDADDSELWETLNRSRSSF